MTDTSDFVRQAEKELRNTRTVSHCTCQLWENLPAETKATFARSMIFLGCQPSGTVENFAPVPSETDRVAAARLMLVKLSLDTDDPRWSSELLDWLLKAVVDASGGAIGELIDAMFEVLGDYSAKLTRPVASIIKDIIVRCFTRYRRSYESANWTRVVERLATQPTQAQLYLALHAIPRQFVTPQLSATVAKALESTAFRDEAAVALAG